MRRLLRLTPVDWWGLGTAYVYLLSAGCRLFVRGKGLERWLTGGPSVPAAQPTSSEVRDAARRGRWVNTAARYPLPWARCLQRSLALCMWMERRGLQPVLNIGVRLDGTALAAHAWVKYGDQVINDNPRLVREFTVLKAPDLGSVGTKFGREGRWV